MRLPPELREAILPIGAAVATLGLLRVVLERRDPERRTFFPAAAHGGQRAARGIRLVVLHCTDSEGSAAGVASWFQGDEAASRPASAHMVVDDVPELYRCLDDLTVADGASGANVDGLHLELVGRATRTRAQWLSKSRELAVGADATARWCRRYGLPAALMRDDELARDGRGITTHAQVTRVFSGGQGHQDPGPGFPLDYFVSLVRARL